MQAGDLVNTSTSDNEWGQRYESTGWIDGMVPSIATPGNHEYSGPVLSPYWRPQFAFPQNGPEGTGAIYDVDNQTFSLQPAKPEPGAGVAVSVTIVPWL